MRAIRWAAVVSATVSAAALGAAGQTPDVTACAAPSGYCGRTLSPVCVAKLGAGATAAVGMTAAEQAIFGEQLTVYRDCLGLMAEQCASTPAAPSSQVGDPTTMLAVWAEVKDSGDPDALDAFAAAYADTPLAALARNRAAALRAAAGSVVTTPPPSPTSAAPDPAPVPSPSTADADALRAVQREAQAHLGRIGYDAGPADGVWGARSARALAAFSRRAGLPDDGALTEAHLAALRIAPTASAPRPALAPSAPDPTSTEKPPRRSAQVGVTMERNNNTRTRCAGFAVFESGYLFGEFDCSGSMARIKMSIDDRGAARDGGFSWDIYQVVLNGNSWRFSGTTNYTSASDVRHVRVSVTLQ